MKKTNLPANFLFYLKSGNLKISYGDNPSINFKAENDLREIDIIDLPIKLPKKFGILKQLREAKKLAKKLKEEKTTLDIKHQGKLIIRLGEKANPKFSKFATLSKNIEIKDLKRFRQLEKNL